MRLRAIELRGFKSFAEAVKLPLDARLIGIVGPNGCGKSNIADALRWIMGEQKGRLLRIEKSDNLIFNGSQRRKPLPFAEVTLEVEDFSPELPRLAFTRRVHRTGESEYFLNGTPARLKDFLQYFWQVGISPQGILDGGQVEALIQDRGGARRALIESLAGIERYHHHKKELLAELEKTETALSQVENILAELRQQIKTLSSQAEKVAAYQNLRAKYRELLAGWIAQELATIAKAEAQQAEQTQAQQATLTTLKAEIEQLELRIKAAEESANQIEIAPLEASYEAFRHEHQNILREESRLQERIQHLERQNKEQTEELALRQRQKGELAAEEQALRQKREATERTLIEKQEALSAISSQLQAITTQLQHAEQRYRQQESQLKQTENALRQLQARRSTIEATLRPLIDRQAQVEMERNTLEERSQALTAEKVAQEERLQAMQSEEKKLSETLQQLRAQREALQKERERLFQQLRQTEAQLQGLMSQRKALEALLSRSEGWPAYLSALRAKGIPFWRTEDIFFAEEPELSRLSLLLRMEVPTLWVTNPEAAAQIEAFLADKKEGFFAVRIYQPSEDGAPTGTWLDKIQALEGFTGLAAYLWGEAIRTGRYNFSPDGRRLYLPDGQVYVLSATATEHIGLPHRIRRIQSEENEAHTLLQTLRAQISAIESQIAALPIQQHQQDLEALRKAITQAEKDLAATGIRIEEIERRRKAISTELQQLKDKQASLTAELEALQPELDNLNAQYTTFQSGLSALEEEVSALKKQHQNLQRSQQELRLTIATLENELKSIDRSYKLTLQQLDEVQKRLLYLSDRGDAYASQLSEAKAQLERLLTRKAEVEPKISDLSHRITELRKEQREITQHLQSLRQALHDKQQQKESLQSSLAKYEVRATELAQRRALLLQRLSVELEMAPDDLPTPPKHRLKADEVETHLQRLKDEIARLGELNFEAASALESLRSREAEIIREKTDIEHTLARLRQLLTALDREAQEKFLNAFEAVRQRFIQLFQGLFAEGDTCDMILVQPESPLTSEIEIIARPKGKRPLSLHQLSGGEKALTALSLLFATFAVRPSALCVLDEVDAPLDDVNTHKFGQLLRRISEETPLIVITHNKITMSYCERLYGVTMPEPGVSTVLAVEMQSAPALAEAV